MINVFIGYDSKETVAYHVLANSIMRRSSEPVSITPLIQDQLRAVGIYKRERGATESTEFSLTRFLVPYLSGYKGVSIFLDCDMLCLADISELEFEIRKGDFLPPKYAVMCCQHDYTPRPGLKFLGNQQTSYPRKNWSSLMVFNNELCRSLTSEYVNSASGLDLHRFNWIEEEKIGELPLEWNWLVGEYEPNPAAKMVHFTCGGPWHSGYEAVDCADLWIGEQKIVAGNNTHELQGL